MTGKTHMLGGATAAATVFLCMSRPINPLWVAFAAVGSLMPDIDHEFSTVSQYPIPAPGVKLSPQKYIARFLQRHFGHRTITHSLLGLFIFCLATLPLGIWLDWGWWLALGPIGYLSHLVLDSLTVSGVMWLYPFYKRHFGLPLVKIHTGGAGELLFSLSLVCALALVIFLSWSTVGWIRAPDHGMLLVASPFLKAARQVRAIIKP